MGCWSVAFSIRLKKFAASLGIYHLDSSAKNSVWFVFYIFYIFDIAFFIFLILHINSL